MKNPALLVIDLLNDFLDQWPLASKKRLLDSTGQLVTIMREHQLPIIWVRRNLNDVKRRFSGDAGEGNTRHDQRHTRRSDCVGVGGRRR